MIKFAFYTDIHWSGTSPKRRKDNYTETVERKHRFIYQDAYDRGCQFILNGGDLNETPLMANSVINRQIEVMKTRKIDEYAIIGNHDVIGSNSEKLNQVSESILFTSGYLERLSRDEPTIITDLYEKPLYIYGVDIHRDMDNLRPEDYYVEKPLEAGKVILVAHGWLTQRDLQMEGIRHTTFRDVIDTGTEADLILTGHYHPGHGIQRSLRKDGKEIIFHNPGSPVRMKALKSEMERKVGYSVITINDDQIDIEFIEFPAHIALPAGEVIDRESLEEDIKREEIRESIAMKYSDISLKSLSPRGVIMEIAENNKLSPQAKEDLIQRIDSVENAMNEEDLTHQV